jgi:hypothetical protein
MLGIQGTRHGMEPRTMRGHEMNHGRSHEPAEALERLSTEY